MDRAALDVALKHGIACGGWCPVGRLDESGRIPDRYPVKELELSNKEGRSPDRPGGLETAAPWEERDVFAARTLQNVKDSDGTVIVYCEQLHGGSEQTVRFCIEQKRPHKLIDAGKISAEDAAKILAEFVREQRIGTLNIAGPRQSEWPDGYEYAFRALDVFCRAMKSPNECE